METKVVCFAVVLAGIYYIITMKVYLHLYYHHRSSADQMLVSVYTLYQLLSYQRDLTTEDFAYYFKLRWLEEKLGWKKHKSKAQKREPYVRQDNLPDWYAKMYRVFSTNFFGGAKCERFIWKTICGVDDAAMAGVIFGALWYIKMKVVHLFQQRMGFAQPPTLEVTPVFSREQFTTEFDFIISARLGDVIFAWLRFSPILNKGVKKHERISDSGPNEDSNAKY